MDSVGDLARMLVLRTNQVRLREEMDVLATEIATGFVKDSATHLNGDVSGLLAIDRTLDRLDAFRVTNSEAKLISGAMQTALDEVQTRSQQVSETLIAAELTPSAPLLNTMGTDARDAFAQVLGTMNRSVGGRFLFSGVATDTAAVTGIDDMMSALQTAVAGQTTAAGLRAEVDAFFATGGDFETTMYQGSATGIAPLRLSENDEATLDIKATDPAFIDIIKPLAIASLATDGVVGLDVAEQVTLLRSAGEDLLSAQRTVVETRSSLGALEARIEESTARIETERTATQLARLDLVGTDEFETATRYEAVRAQLESLYAITVRSQRLSMTEYF